LVHLPLCLILLGCDSEPQSEEFIENGIHILCNYRPVRGSLPGEIVPAEGLSLIGETESDVPEEALIIRIADVIAGPGGKFYVLDSRDCCVKVFDLDGQFLKAFGRKGEGPGEFQNPQSLLWLSSGLIAVLDQSDPVISVFTPEGEFVSLRRTRGWEHGFRARDFSIRAGDGLYFYTNRNIITPELKVEQHIYISQVDSSYQARKFDRSDTDTLQIFRGIRDSDRQVWTNLPSDNCIRSHPSGYLIVAGASYTFFKVKEGNISSGFRQAGGTIKLPDWWREPFHTRWVESGRRGKDPSLIREYRPYPGSIVIDDRGHLWSQVNGGNIPYCSNLEEVNQFGLVALDEFTQNGKWLRQVIVQSPVQLGGIFITDTYDEYFYGYSIPIGEIESYVAFRFKRPY